LGARKEVTAEKLYGQKITIKKYYSHTMKGLMLGNYGIK
jgi:hypothetical protein